ncbi:uncharacterized protein LOC124663198 [Lolium rigidum]|uniref:uncharacterized protein LOC124663198 n=1 Tax=Lolium rigidum TaxID=89674 RepID=UPI001F5E1860|nr:uncharacterized protein LOC124663198 [Lolium rigidum]
MLKTNGKDVPARTRSRNLRLNEASSRLIDREGGVLSQELAAELSPSIVSLASFDGEKLHSQCTGTVVRNDRLGSSIVTSRDLVTTTDSGYVRTLKLKVHLPNGEVVNASVQYYSVAHNMLVVTTGFFPDIRAACIPQMQVDSSTRLLAASLCHISDKFWVTTGVLTDSPTGVESHETMWSTCEITEAGSGGPLVDFDGNIVGMNLCMKKRKTSFVPAKRIVECMDRLGFWTYLENTPTPSNFSSEGTSSLGTILGSSSQNRASEGNENKNQEPCTFPIHEANDVWCDLNQALAEKLSPSIISIASFDGEALHSECTGMVIDRELSSASFLTTASLFGSLDQNLWDDLTIKVRLPNDEVVHGWLHYYSSPYSLAVIITHSLPPSLDLCVACLGNDMHVESSAELLAVRRCFDSGKLVSTRGSVIHGTWTGGIHKKQRKLSTCKIIEAASGGPLVDCDGNIVGMNYYDEEMTSFVPSNLIFEWLAPAHVHWAASKDTSRPNEIQQSSTPYNDSPKGLTDDELRRILAPWRCNEFRNRVNAILLAKGYPLPSFADDGMYLKWDFEEGFGKDILSEPTSRVASKMSRSVVALASFVVDKTEYSGEHRKEKKIARKFACTGVFIECSGSTTRILTSASLVRSGDGKNIHREWKIEVCLPSKRRVDGTLLHYDLKYNVAVVSIKGVCSYRAAKLDETSQTEIGAQVVALGRGFESAKLMATEGAVTAKRSRSYCEELQISTCKITKAGIGGPLVDFGGNFVGMNFYDTDQTPYLSRVRILELMKCFNAERTVPVAVETPDESELPSWPVPDPEWFYPSRYPKPRYVEFEN